MIAITAMSNCWCFAESVMSPGGRCGFHTSQISRSAATARTSQMASIRRQWLVLVFTETPPSRGQHSHLAGHPAQGLHRAAVAVDVTAAARDQALPAEGSWLARAGEAERLDRVRDTHVGRARTGAAQVVLRVVRVRRGHRDIQADAGYRERVR